MFLISIFNYEVTDKRFDCYLNKYILTIQGESVQHQTTLATFECDPMEMTDSSIHFPTVHSHETELNTSGSYIIRCNWTAYHTIGITMSKINTCTMIFPFISLLLQELIDFLIAALAIFSCRILFSILSPSDV